LVGIVIVMFTGPNPAGTIVFAILLLASFVATVVVSCRRVKPPVAE
jgi:hypothetical protein